MKPFVQIKLFASAVILICFLYIIYHASGSVAKQLAAKSPRAGRERGRKAVVNYTLYNTRPFVIWANDFHIGPIADLKHTLEPLNVKFIDQSLSGHCHLTHTCARGLRVLNQGNGINLPRDVIPRFYDAYQNDNLMKQVDAFVCFHPTSLCELFMPFKRSIILIASTRYEMGRHSADRWKEWNSNLLKIASDKNNVIAANNRYDAEYIRYFTGIPARVLPSWCDYTGATYTGARPGFLLAPIHKPGFQDFFLKEFENSLQRLKKKTSLRPLRSVYPHYQYTDLAAHKGIVYVPYQVSVMSLFEQYRMNIPLFFPSLNLLTDWQLKHHVMNERTWEMVFGRTPKGSLIGGALEGVPDPNNELDRDAIQYWIKFADFYSLPNITYYSSMDDLVYKLENADLQRISDAMNTYNTAAKAKLVKTWTNIIFKLKLNALQKRTRLL